MARSAGKSKKFTPAVPAALPERIAPMLAQLTNEPFDSPDHLFEIKWDGIRCVAFIESALLRLQNRRFTELRERFPELQGLAELPGGTVLDGEIVVLKNGKPSFELLQQRMHQTNPRRIATLSQRLPATLIVFDLLYFRYRSLLAEPLYARRKQLTPLLRKLTDPHVLASESVLEQGKKYFAAARHAALEGIMAKRLDSPYHPGKRSPDWIKIKVPQVGVFDVLGYVPRSGASIISALVIGKDGSLKGKVGSGFTEAQRAELFHKLHPKKPLRRPPAGRVKGAVWITSDLRCRVRYLEETSDGKLRAPVFAGLVTEKAPP